jgi:hypothetical protein
VAHFLNTRLCLQKTWKPQLCTTFPFNVDSRENPSKVGHIHAKGGL